MIRCVVGIFALTCVLAGCSSRQVYDGAAGWRQNECDRIVDATERSRCLDTANLEYERYRRERDKAGEAR
ncbi:hypothetical protein [Methyloversatilis sp. NSM2]|uniref:hypothetical protein n=1 Tax=Methyloversatilis sp. NSM2 TaxID=3134135 RepID=UPI003118D112